MFVGDVRGADAGIVGVERDPDAALVEPADWMRRRGGDGAGLDVAGERELECDAVFSEVVHQCRVLDGMHAVADPLGTEEAYGVPHRLRPGGLTGVRRQVQAYLLTAAGLTAEP